MNIATHDAMLRTLVLALPFAARVAFASACAERCLTLYSDALDDATRRTVRRAIDLGWETAEQRIPEVNRVGVAPLAVEQVIKPDDADLPDETSMRVQELLIVTLYLLRTLEHGAGENAFWAARAVTDACDRLAQRALPSGLLSRSAADRLSAHPIVQLETEAQRADVASMTGCDTVAPLVASVRARADATGRALRALL
jgi:hypothetical protein